MINHDIKRAYRSDTTNAWASDSLIAFMSRQAELMDKYELAIVYLNFGMYTAMENTLAQVATEFEMDSLMLADHQDLVELTRIAQVMLEDTLYPGALDSLDRLLLEQVVEADKPLLAPMALSLLKRQDPDYWFADLVLDMPLNASRTAAPQVSGPVAQEQEEFQLYPNPTHGYTTLRYACGYDRLSYHVLDIHSRVLRSEILESSLGVPEREVLIDLQGLVPGTYQVRVSSGQVVLWTGKLVIQ